MYTLSKQQTIGQYTMAFPIKEGDYAETYRVKDAAGKNFFLKLIDIGKCGARQFDAEDNLIEVDIVRGLDHPCVMHPVEQWETSVNGRAIICLVSDFISGETLEQRICRERSNPYETRRWICDVLSGLQYLHSQVDPIIHNEITLQNVMLDVINQRAVIIDMGHARHFSSGRRLFDKKGLPIVYLAPEVIGGGRFYVQSDIFSVGVMAYQLLWGGLPWRVNKNDDIEEHLQEQREQPLRVPTLSGGTIPDGIVETIAKALAVDPNDRFRTADEMARALKGEIHVSSPIYIIKEESTPHKHNTQQKIAPKFTNTIPKGNGFRDVAGMKELKAQLQRDVIDVIKDPEKSLKYGLSLPNGVILYGPPGCGKTYFAKKLAEEVGYNYMEMKPSDLKSKWVNATQENIAAMFREAEENAPTIIFIDEINELLPKRSSNVHEMSRSAVNEMLAQMDRTGERGIFVIGATNMIETIDEAITRSGRLEKQIYVGPPDKEARQEMFEMYLKDRYIDLGIDYEHLATLTEGYVSSDIKYMVDEAARSAKDKDVPISMTIIEQTIQQHPSSLKEAQNKHKPIGFK